MLWFTVLAVCCASACARAAVQGSDKPFYPAEAHGRLFEEFKVTYNKYYATQEEDQHRFEIFKNNVKSINALNAEYKETVYGITKFSDLTKEEFVERYTGLLVDKSRKTIPRPLLDLSSVEAPESFDWREKNVVTRVKDQKTCRSCWAFGLIGCLESQYALKYNKLVDFSEKQLIDCDKYDYGCSGGNYANAVGYMLTTGIMTNDTYPYVPKADKCQFDANKAVAHIKGFESYVDNDELTLKKVLYTKGPIAISIDASVLRLYKRGVIQDCKHDAINHAVLLVGYGTENGVDYWLIKNSSGESFGEKGYFKIERGLYCLGISHAPGAEVMLLLL